MKRLLFLGLLVCMCFAYGQDIIGPIALEDLRKEPFAEWFNTEYENYAPFGKTITQLEGLQKDVAITIFMGTWCSDSQMHVPAFFRILDALAFSGEVQIIGVDREKKKHLRVALQKMALPMFLPLFFTKTAKKSIALWSRPLNFWKTICWLF
jgi:hypothetical protein